ncbi:MAG: hypothetical protein ACP5KN_12370 [Armatimonadota bacterium]
MTYQSGPTYTRPLADAERSDEPVHYDLCPLADAQWRATVEWARAHGNCEVALHAVGDPDTRSIISLVCGEQDVSSGSCSTRPEGVAHVARQAAADRLRVLGQVHHHPMQARVCAAQWNPDAAFFLSVTDYRLLEQLSSDLGSAVVQFQRVARRGPLLMRAGEAPELTVNGRRFRLRVQTGAELALTGVHVEGVLPTTHVFVAVTGSDGLLHGEVLRAELCEQCLRVARRSLHPLELRPTSEAVPAGFGASSFDRAAWYEILERRVTRTWGAGYWKSHAHGGREMPYTDPDAYGWRKSDRAEPSRAAVRRDVGREIHRLQGLVEEDVLRALRELRSLAQGLPGQRPAR